MDNERKRTNTAEKQSKEPRGSGTGAAGTDGKPERPLGWDARDFEADVWIRDSPRSTEGRYEDRFFQDE